jgi:glutamine phosphoribosylpyrophosphate amidotransferase
MMMIAEKILKNLQKQKPQGLNKNRMVVMTEIKGLEVQHQQSVEYQAQQQVVEGRQVVVLQDNFW